MMTPTDDANPADAFAKMFANMFGAMGTPSAAPDPMQVGKQMQRAFLDAMARQCDEFMRSEQFLEMMKRSMDGAIAFRQQLDRFLNQARESMPDASQGTSAELLEAIRQMDHRINSRLDGLEQRLDQVESGSPKKASPNKSTAGKSRQRRGSSSS